jgi:hypothetical protein
MISTKGVAVVRAHGWFWSGVVRVEEFDGDADEP